MMAIATGGDNLKSISVEDFLTFGLEKIVYIRELEGNDGEGFAIHGADGRLLSVQDSFALATSLVQQNQLYPVTLQ